VHRHTAPRTCNIWTAASRNAKLSCVQRVASKQLRSQSVITKSGLSCSIVSTTDKFIVWMNWNGGSSTSGAVLNSWFLDETIDQWRGRHRAYVHAKRGHFEYSLWTDNVDFVHTCYTECDLFNCYIFNYEIVPATLFILQGSALADLRYGGRFYGTLCCS